MIYFIIAVVLLLVSFVLAKIKPEYRRLLIIISSVITITYIVWRFTTVPSNSVLNFALGAILLISELIGVSQFFIFEYLFTKNYKLKQRTLSDFAEDKIPEVDVLICTYNEPLKLVEKTMLAATQMNYVKGKLNVYVCDDGKRDELKRLCGKYNIGYITREGNEGAKAGNINNALKVIKGDLFAVLDADMIPTKNFLERTIGYFSEENVAFVQTPQVYYNQDMYQYNLRKKVPNEQDFFMRDIQSARASINAVLHIGTNAVFRKKYVDE
ncbi:Cellulose synthase catalytic subunit [UDP-forming] [Sarcina ventriculi]|nr:glycosyltransferase [Sarcina ventriculi]SPZ50746.1 Cellulose synthase catalytic subunit [UDP-forming] [Sarcina ventriculi]